MNDGMNILSRTVGSGIKMCYKTDGRFIFTAGCCGNMSHNIAVIVNVCILYSKCGHFILKLMGQIELTPG